MNELVPAFVLHARDYRDTSLLIEFFTPSFGRISAVAKGARRLQRGTSQRAILQPLQPLLIAWSGRSELKSLRTAEVRAPMIPLRGHALFSAFYMNELLCRLLQREDEQMQLFADYETALEQLGGDLPLDITLRRFELCLLEALGYGFSLVHEGESGMPVAAERHYHFDPQRGLVPTQKIHAGQTLFSGADLLAFARGDFTDSARRSAKLLCRAALHVHLGGKPLQTRSLFSS